MSRLTELIAQARAKDEQLGADLEREFRGLSQRLSFGLNFERHSPEAVHLPQQPIRKGDKVRLLPARGTTTAGDARLWRVARLHKHGLERMADIELIDPPGATLRTVATQDLAVIAEFRDTIYPGLVCTGRVERSNARPYHTVINGENYHVLKALTYTHRGRVDAIYIDPPYNTGAKDWKYNNDYVEKEDLYRHSKWLAMMERRLHVAHELMNPSCSVLIVTIDEKEYLRLGLLLEQTFPDATVEMVTTVVNPRGRHRQGRFARSEEYIFFVLVGSAVVEQELDPDFGEGSQVQWRTLRRSDVSSARGTAKGGPAQFYPIYINGAGQIHHIGDALPHGSKREEAPVYKGCEAVFPIRDSGTEMNWGLTAPALRALHSKGYVRVGRYTPDKPQRWEVSYLTSGKIEDITTGRAVITGKRQDGSVIAEYVANKLRSPTSTWMRQAHNAETGGTYILQALLPGRSFPFPKSLYAVEDTLRFFIKHKRDAVVLDFFAGSGTTAHAVMRLNRQDGGSRQCISVTNNEVAADEQRELREKGLRPGDAEWEQWGVCDYITKPRVAAAISGITPDGTPIAGEYKHADEFSMADGFEESAEFFTLTYETPIAVSQNAAFARIAPLLWLRAGSLGRRIERLPAQGWAVVDAYGLLVDVDCVADFCRAVKSAPALRIAYIVTDDERRFQAIARRLPSGVEPVRLYESYLTNFSFANGV